MRFITAGPLRAVLGGLAMLVAMSIPFEARAGAAEQTLITHYYQALLRRAPDAGGLAYWDGEATRLRNAGQDPKEVFIAMAAQFIDSAEYRAFNRDTNGYLTDLYQAFFSRAPDAGGLAYWAGQIAAGLPRGIVLNQFLFSTEFSQYVASQLGSTSGRPEGTTVIDFYRSYLFRLPDDGGLSYWVWQFRSAQCLGGGALATSANNMSALFQSSAEYGGRNRTDSDFVADLYGAFLRRGGDLPGVQYWIAQLGTGVSRDVVRSSFLASTEFQARLAAIDAADCYAPPLAQRQDAARLLQQGTWGATLVEISRVADIGTEAWLAEQFAAPASNYTALAQQNIDLNKAGANGCDQASGCPWQVHRPMFYGPAFEGSDQLRQRVTNALSQIMVTSIANNRLSDSGTGMSSYLDTLSKGAFGNFRDLLEDVTLHPAMGVYLDMLGSSLEVPNENYARELLQLFSVGTVMLNADGTPQLDVGGKPIATYDEDTVKGFARAFTGWHFADQDMTKSWKFYWPDEKWTVPMKVWTARRCPQDGHWPAGTTTWCDLNNAAKSFPPPHETGTKKLLQYAGAVNANLPAGQTPQKDIDDAMDNIFRHPNVGPFIGKQLIQRLVTSNPSPAYVARVAAVFANNGAGVRGDMKAVVRAILIDAEARSPASAAANNFGKLREPVWKFIHLHRAFNTHTTNGYYDTWSFTDTSALNQSPLEAPSVFNFYGRDSSPAGPMGAAGLTGPEFELATASAITGFADFTNWAVVGGFNNGAADLTTWFRPNYDRYLAGTGALADNPQKMIDELDILLTAGNLKTQFKADLVTALNGVTRSAQADQRRDRFRIALWQIIHSAEYAVQR